MENIQQNSPRVSVVIPMYNCEEFVQGVLSMFSQQSFRDFEVICVSRPRRFGKSFAAKIKDKQYPDAIKDYGGDVLPVGIKYDTED